MYDVVLADPPWPYHKHSDTRQPFAEDHYGLMSAEEIYELPIASVMNSKSILFLWATSPKLHLAIEAIDRWGLVYRGIAHVWVKTRLDGKPLNGNGPRPTYSKPQSELLLFASRVKTGRPLPIAVENLPHQILAPRGAHSAKPEIFQDQIDRAYPGASKLELFARRQRAGWDCTGLELTGLDYRSGALSS